MRSGRKTGVVYTEKCGEEKQKSVRRGVSLVSRKKKEHGKQA